MSVQLQGRACGELTFHQPRGSEYLAAPAPSPDKYLSSSEIPPLGPVEVEELLAGPKRFSTLQTSSRKLPSFLGLASVGGSFDGAGDILAAYS